ncbi:DUF4181 domain-containing protein [Gottfriedia sp. NPDC057948]|uniref:DUF4181 domain-containing protein n=1 Tax=Gottfriedia sp. NPDC057948 TaxID=3346287 RepID=UPI0036DE75FD
MRILFKVIIGYLILDFIIRLVLKQKYNREMYYNFNFHNKSQKIILHTITLLFGTLIFFNTFFNYPSLNPIILVFIHGMIRCVFVGFFEQKYDKGNKEYIFGYFGSFSYFILTILGIHLI